MPPKRAPHAYRGRGQHRISCAVAVRIVDALHLVQVDEQHCSYACTGFRVDHFRQPSQPVGSVGQTGEGVVIGDVGQLFSCDFLRGHVEFLWLEPIAD